MDVVQEGNTLKLKVTNQEINDYFYRITWNKIRSYFSEIIMRMDKYLREEIRSKRTDLVPVKNEKGEEVKNLYKFTTKDGSEELNNYLANFMVEVVD